MVIALNGKGIIVVSRLKIGKLDSNTLSHAHAVAEYCAPSVLNDWANITTVQYLAPTAESKHPGTSN